MKILKTLVLSSLILGSTTLFASNLSATNERTNLLLDKKEIASITVLTPVEIIKSNKGISSIKIKGFRLEDYPQMVVRDMKRGEIYVEFSEEDEKLASKSFKVIKSFEDDYGEVWQEVEGEFKIKTSALAKDTNALNVHAQKTYEQTCTMCHRLHEPHDFTVNQWPHQVESMMTEIPLEKKVKELIVKYLQHNAEDSK